MSKSSKSVNHSCRYQFMTVCCRGALVLVILLMAVSDARCQDSTAKQTTLYRICPRTPQELRGLFHHSDRSLPIVSGHRGGAGPGYPENCIETFEHTLSQTFAMLEIDPRLTKDGHVVVHHDATLDRTTTGTGKLVDKTLAQLKELRLKDSEGNVTEYRIPTLGEVIEWARGKTVLVLDQKDVPLATRVAKVSEHQAESYVMLIIGNYRDAKACHEMNSEIMMEVMVPSHEKIADFDATGIPWDHVIAFLGHVPPRDPTLYAAVNERGASTMVGTSRNIDRDYPERVASNQNGLRHDYRMLLDRGADLIETDLPRELGPLLFKRQSDVWLNHPVLRKD